MIWEIAGFCLLGTITALFNARIYWLVKYKKEDPLKAVKPWWVELERRDKIEKEFIDRG